MATTLLRFSPRAKSEIALVTVPQAEVDAVKEAEKAHIALVMKRRKANPPTSTRESAVRMRKWRRDKLWLQGLELVAPKAHGSWWPELEKRLW